MSENVVAAIAISDDRQAYRYILDAPLWFVVAGALAKLQMRVNRNNTCICEFLAIRFGQEMTNAARAA